MTAARSPLAILLPGLGAGLLVWAVVAGEPAIVAIAAPFALVAALGSASPTPQPPEVRIALDSARALEGDRIWVDAVVCSERRLDGALIELGLPDGLETEQDRGRVVTLPAGHPVRVSFALRCPRWGAYTGIGVRASARDRSGLRILSSSATVAEPLRVLPPVTRLRELVPPQRVRAESGGHVARQLGEGTEYAQLRPFSSGDRLRAVNWRATARHGALWVNDRHPERATTLLLFVDSFRRAGWERDEALGLAVHAATALAREHLTAGDRVGLVELGGVLRWIPPGIGRHQLHRIAEALLESEILETAAEKGAEVLPLRGLPAGSLVVALTPLLDERAVTTLLQLRRRGFDVVIVECTSATPGPEPGDLVAQVAARLWALEREAIRSRLRHAGTVIVSWEADTPLAPVLHQLLVLRRRPQRRGTG